MLLCEDNNYSAVTGCNLSILDTHEVSQLGHACLGYATEWTQRAKNQQKECLNKLGWSRGGGEGDMGGQPPTFICSFMQMYRRWCAIASQPNNSHCLLISWWICSLWLNNTNVINIGNFVCNLLPPACKTTLEQISRCQTLIPFRSCLKMGVHVQLPMNAPTHLIEMCLDQT